MTDKAQTAAGEAVAVYSTYPDIETAEAIGGDLVERGLAACVNILPQMRSIYRWQGAIEEDEEVVAIVKTQRSRVAEVVAAIEARHPYDTPAIVVFAIVAGSAPYLDWIASETGSG